MATRRPGTSDSVLLARRDHANAVVGALAASGCRALVGWDDGAVHLAHAPLLLACQNHNGYEIRAPCGEATRAVALAGDMAAAAQGVCVDLWSTIGTQRLSIGVCVTALCLHSDWLLVGAGTKGQVELWEPRAARRVGLLAGACGGVRSLTVSDDGDIVRCSAEGGATVLHSRPPVRLFVHD